MREMKARVRALRSRLKMRSIKQSLGHFTNYGVVI